MVKSLLWSFYSILELIIIIQSELSLFNIFIHNPLIYNMAQCNFYDFCVIFLFLASFICYSTFVKNNI